MVANKCSVFTGAVDKWCSKYNDKRHTQVTSLQFITEHLNCHTTGIHSSARNPLTMSQSPPTPPPSVTHTHTHFSTTTPSFSLKLLPDYCMAWRGLLASHVIVIIKQYRGVSVKECFNRALLGLTGCAVSSPHSGIFWLTQSD